jgi:hypothetical protein
MAKFTFKDYRAALNDFAVANIASELYRPQRLSIGHLKLCAGQYHFVAKWKGIELLSGPIPKTHQLNGQHRSEYVSMLVLLALTYVDVDKLTLL